MVASRNVFGFISFDEIGFGIPLDGDGINEVHVLPQQKNSSDTGYAALDGGKNSAATETRINASMGLTGNSGRNDYKVSSPAGSGFRTIPTYATTGLRYVMWCWRGKITKAVTTGTAYLQGIIIFATCGDTKNSPLNGAMGICIRPDELDPGYKFNVDLMESNGTKWISKSTIATAVTLSGSPWDSVTTWALVIDRDSSPFKAKLIYWDGSAWSAYNSMTYVTGTNTGESSLESIGCCGGGQEDPSATSKETVGLQSYGWWSMEQSVDTLDNGTDWTSGTVDNEVKNWRCMSRYPSADTATAQWTATNACNSKHYTTIDDMQDSRPTSGADYLSCTDGNFEDKFEVRGIPAGSKIKAVYMAGPVTQNQPAGTHTGPQYFKLYDSTGNQELAPAQGVASGIDAGCIYAFFPNRANGSAWDTTTINDNTTFFASIRHATPGYSAKIWGLVIGMLGVDITQGDYDTCGVSAFTPKIIMI